MKGDYFLSRRVPARTTSCSATTRSTTSGVADNYQSGSSYRIIGTTTIIVGTTIFPQLLTTGANRRCFSTTRLRSSSLGTNFRTHSSVRQRQLRVEQQRRRSTSALRFDKNHGVDSAGNLVAKDSALEPAHRRHLGSEGQRRVGGDRQLREVRGRHRQQHRRLARRRPATRRRSSGRTRARAINPDAQRGDAGRHGDRDSADVQLVRT